MKRDDPPSKTRRKREVQDLQALGESLIQMSDERLSNLPLPDALRAAVNDARRMTKRGALRRQRQYIGKIMRSIDPEPIRSALHDADEVDRHAARVFKLAERWRDRLIAEGEAALDELTAAVGDVDTVPLRGLIVDAQHDSRTGVKRGHARKLFRTLHDLFADRDRSRSER